ncbi:MAG: hypothetical protein V8Q57_04785 [Blautia sp.]
MLRKIAVCDDVEVERFVLKRQLMSYFRLTGAKAEIREYVSGESLLADIEEGYIWPDLIFLDIYMGNLNGMDTARHSQGNGRGGTRSYFLQHLLIMQWRATRWRQQDIY